MVNSCRSEIEEAVGERAVTEYVCNCLFSPFPRCERECRAVVGCPMESRLKRQSQLPHKGPGEAANPSLVPLRAEGRGRPEEQQESLIGPFFHSHKGDRAHAGSLLRKGLKQVLAEWVNRASLILMHIGTHIHTLMLFQRAACLARRHWEKIWSRGEDKSNFKLTSVDLGHTDIAEIQRKKKGTVQTRLELEMRGSCLRPGEPNSAKVPRIILCAISMLP